MFNAMGCFYAVIQWRNQGNSDMVYTGVNAVKFSGQKAAGQYCNVFPGKKQLSKIGIGDRRFQPYIKTRRRFLYYADISQNGYKSCEFFTI